jgi:LPS-assembly protein
LKPTPRNRFELTPLALLACGLVHGGAALAQPGEPGITLRGSPLLREQLPADQRTQFPTFVEGDRVTGRTDFETIVEGSPSCARATP